MLFSSIRRTIDLRCLLRPDSAVFAIIAVFSFFWVYRAGKDLSWDALNYHVYGPLSLLSDRLSQDFFAASVQGYLNPLGYIPFFWMLEAGLHSLVVAALFTCIHLINIALILRLSRTLFGEGRESDWLVALSVGLAASSSIYWSLVGSSFLDLIVSIPLLAAAIILLKGYSGIRAFWAGSLMGLATGLKLSSIIFPIAALGFFMFGLRKLTPWKIGLIRYFCGCGFGFVGAYGYWAWQLWREFSSPAFPFFNEIFQSPYFLQSNLSFGRYVVDGFADWVLFPLRIALPSYGVYTELINPDLKIIGLLVAIAILFWVWFFTRRHSRSEHNDAVISRPATVAPAIVFWVVGFVLWGMTSGAGRYAVLLFLLSGPFFILVVRQISARSVRFVGAGLLCFQLISLAVVGIPRWGDRSEWGEQWFDFSVPQPMIDRPAVYLSLGMNSMSFLAYKIHASSSFINISGQYAVPAQGMAGDRARKIIEGHAEVRSLFPVSIKKDERAEVSKHIIYERYKSLQQVAYGRFSLEPAGDCFLITQNGATENAKNMMSCALVRSTAASIRFDAERKYYERLVSLLEDSCPQLLQPSGLELEQKTYGWEKFYFNSDARLSIVNGYAQLHIRRAPNPINIGNLAEIQADNSLLKASVCAQ